MVGAAAALQVLGPSPAEHPVWSWPKRSSVQPDRLVGATGEQHMNKVSSLTCGEGQNGLLKRNGYFQHGPHLDLARLTSTTQ